MSDLGLNRDPEIEKALKEFEQNSEKERIIKTVADLKASENSKMAQLVIKYSGGAIKEQKQAEYVLLGFALLVIAISLFLLLID
jgi:hypothetical protein